MQVLQVQLGAGVLAGVLGQAMGLLVFVLAQPESIRAP
jgi:hypothetical protein